MMENGTRISNMDTVLKYDPMVQSMKVIMKWAENKERVILNGLMVVHMKEISIIIIFMVLGFMNGLTGEDIRESGETTRCMERENLLGQMEENMLEIILTIKNKVMESLLGLMAENIKDFGKMGNNMEKEYI